MTRQYKFGILSILMLAISLLFQKGPLAAWDQPLEKNRKYIESMTKAEREELLKKYRRFKRLSPNEKKELRDLDQKLRNDEQMNDAKMVYYHWLRTLDPWERNQLRNEKDPEKRIKLVKKFLSQQKGPRFGMGMDQFNFSGDDDLPDERPSKLSDEELELLFGKIEENVSLNDKEKEKLSKADPLLKKVTLMNHLLDRKSKFPEQVYLELIDSLSNDSVKQQLKQANSPEKQIRDFQIVLAGSLFSRLHDELEKPSEEELKQHFSEINSFYQDRLLTMPEEMRKHVLRRMYLKQNNPELDSEANRFFKNLRWLFPPPPGDKNRFKGRKKFGDRPERRSEKTENKPEK